MNYYGRHIKRIIDLIIIFCLSPALLISMVAIYVILLVAHGRPVLFKQIRQGIHGKPFVLYKFRTLKITKSEELSFTADDVTKTGRVLRNTGMDELPQFYNILIGDMSAVGPRPLPLTYAALYNNAQKKRFMVKPGITGFAQIKGGNTISWNDRFSMDNWYVDNMSLRLDLKIIIQTIRKIVQSVMICNNSPEIMPVFKGRTEK